MPDPNIHVSHQPGRARPFAGLVAQAPGFVEERVEITCRNRGRRGFPVAGPSGWNFESYLGYLTPKRTRWDYYIDNVYDRRITDDDLSTLCQPKPAEENGFANDQTRPIMNIRVPGGKGYLRAEGWQQLSRLYHNIEQIDPPILIALGAFATFALTGRNLPLSTHRGVLTTSHLLDARGNHRYVIPAYHPSPRNQLNAPLLMFDLMKADNFVKGVTSWEMPSRTVLIPETVADVALILSKALYAKRAACDIETTIGRGFIKSLQVAFREDWGAFIPFYSRECGPYWSEEDHFAVVKLCKQFLEGPIAKIFHKGPFDTEWLWQTYNIGTRNYRHDTSLKAHAIFTELPRDLGTLGANFMHEIAWKGLAKHGDEGKEE
jgi:uracil-DNA glycosylase